MPPLREGNTYEFLTETVRPTLILTGVLAVAPTPSYVPIDSFVSPMDVVKAVARVPFLRIALFLSF